MRKSSIGGGEKDEGKRARWSPTLISYLQILVLKVLWIFRSPRLFYLFFFSFDLKYSSTRYGFFANEKSRANP